MTALSLLGVGLVAVPLRHLSGAPSAAWNVLAGASVIVLAVQTRGLALSHPTRARIYAHLLMLPGDHFRSIARTLGLGIGEVRHHLGILLRNGLVREDKSNQRCRYYVRGDDFDPERNALFEKHWSYRDLRLRVLFAAKNLPEVRPSAVAATLGISRQLAAYHLAQLAELGLIRREGRSYRV